MALFKILKGVEKKDSSGKSVMLNPSATNGAPEIHEGWAYVTTDEGNMYVDVTDKKRVKIGAKSDLALQAISDNKGQNIAETYLAGIALTEDDASPIYVVARGDNTTFNLKIPVADTNYAGVITAGDQAINGKKTMHGRLVILGNASDKKLMTRGIVGSDGDGNEGDLYLQYSNSASDSIYLGASGTHKIHSNGAQYTGNAATATKAVNDDKNQNIAQTYVKGLTYVYKNKSIPELKFVFGDNNEDYVAVPVATNTNGGIVTTAAQTFGGAKTFNGAIIAKSTIAADKNISTKKQLISTVAKGTAPLVVTSDTVVTNLNADYVDGKSASNDTFTAGGASTDIVPTQRAIMNSLNDMLMASQALVYRGLIDPTDKNTYPPTPVTSGSVYVISKEGTFDNQYCEPGDIVIGYYIASSNKTQWDIIQNNINGAVVIKDGGSVSRKDITLNAIPRFDTANGRVIKNSKITIDDAGALLPVSNNVQEIGASTNVWKNIFATNFIGLATNATYDDIEFVGGNPIKNKYIAGIQLVDHATAPYYQAYDGTNSAHSTFNLPIATPTTAGVITNSTQTISGGKTIDKNGSLVIKRANGFNYEGLQKNSAAKALTIWFSHNTIPGTPCINDRLTFNPSSTATWTNYDANTPAAYGELKADRFNGIALQSLQDDMGGTIKKKYFAGVALTNHATAPYYTFYDGTNTAFSPTLPLPVANTTNAGVVTTAAQTFAGNKTFKGALTVAARATVDTLKISKTEAAKHIEFARGGFNYIATAANGCIAFLPNGASTGEYTCRLIVEDGGARPGATNIYNLGTSNKRWKNIYGNALDISGTSTLTGAVTLGGNLSVGGTLGVTGATTLSSTLTVTGKTVLSSVVEIGNNLTVTGAILGKDKLTIGQADLNTNYTVYVNGSSYFKGNVTSNGTLHLTKTTDGAATADNNVALIIGPRDSTHLIADNNEIMAKSNGTAAGPLYLNNDGGQVVVGAGGFTTSGYVDATGDNGFRIRRSNVTYGRFCAITAGTTSAAGVGHLTLGNSTSTGTTNNAAGVLRLYGLGDKYTDIRTVQGSGNHAYYFSNHGQTGYSIARGAVQAYGGLTTPVWINASGNVVAFVNTIGSTAKPIYMSGGSLTECSANVGASDKPVYMNDGTITESNSNIGNGTRAVYMASGQIKASTSSVGGSTTPMYLLNGIMTSCDYGVGALHATDISATDERVYLLGTSSSSTGYRTTTYFDPEIYITTLPGQLSCTSVESRGNLYGGNNIYLRHGTFGEYARLFVRTPGTACTTNGTAGATGVTYMHLGNSIAVSTAAGHGNGNSCGVLRIYGSDTGYTDIRCGTNSTSKHTLYLPGGTGQIVYHTNDIPIGGPDTPVCVTARGQVMPCSTNLTDYVLKAGDTMTGNLAIKKASGTTSFTTERTDTKVSVTFGVGSDGTNRGVYDNSLARWIIYSDGIDAARTGLKLYGAVWNDYAEFRQTKDKVEPGRVVIETGRGDLKLSTERLQPGANVVSDTFGFAIGETKKAKTPLAVAGRVLVYTFEDKYSYKPGDAVCTGPNGTVSKMTREEIWKYPERIVGTVSEIPEYEIWESGDGPIQVNSRIWIKVK